ncbi:MAG: general secretion pathway protein GspB, partial [Rubrivivax sp.]|nr:general secretion pathway protein GspB [Rubrivivax sp.]
GSTGTATSRLPAPGTAGVTAGAPAGATAGAGASPAQPPATGGATATRPIPLAQLPEPQRRELPPLALGGSVWSDNAPSRFVILDGQVLREGDSIAPGLVLERIQRKSVLLRWRELRLEIAL